MKPRKKSPPQKSPDAPLHLHSFGGAEALLFKKSRGFVRIAMETAELHRIVEALTVFALRKQRIPDIKVMAALATLDKWLGVTGKGFNAHVTADVPIGGNLVSLCPEVQNIPSDEPPDEGWESGH